MGLTDQIIGYIGCTLLVFAFIPQVYHVFHYKSANDISSYFLILQIITCIVMIVYSILIEQIPLIFANIAIFIQIILLVIGKYKYSPSGSYNIRSRRRSSSTVSIVSV